MWARRAPARVAAGGTASCGARAACRDGPTPVAVGISHRQQARRSVNSTGVSLSAASGNLAALYSVRVSTSVGGLGSRPGGGGRLGLAADRQGCFGIDLPAWPV